jgi:hypothetical protein
MHLIRTSAVAVHKQHEQCRFTHATSTAQDRCLIPSQRTTELCLIVDDAATEIHSLLKGRVLRVETTLTYLERVGCQAAILRCASVPEENPSAAC